MVSRGHFSTDASRGGMNNWFCAPALRTAATEDAVSQKATGKFLLRSAGLAAQLIDTSGAMNYFALAGGTIPFIRRYSTNCP